MKEKSRIITTIKKVIPAVVSIVITKRLRQLEEELRERFYPFYPFFPPIQIPREMIDSKGRIRIGGGSGFIFDSSGLILSNRHVISEPNVEYTVITHDEKRYPARVLATDPTTDVAIIKIEPKKPLPTVKLGDSNELELGQTVLAIGYALGIFQNTVSKGIISGLSRAIVARTKGLLLEESEERLKGLIQTDAAVNLGNSGGPLVNVFGEVIGINVAAVIGAENIGFAIPINAAKRALVSFKKYGRIARPFLGVKYLTVNKRVQQELKLPVDYGALIIRSRGAIVLGSPADKAGLLPGDIILECNGKKISTKKTLSDHLEEFNAGDEIELSVLRGTEKFRIKITLAERP